MLSVIRFLIKRHLLGLMDPAVLKELEDYPNILKRDYLACCTWEGDVQTINAPFVRILPKHFLVKDVSYIRKRQGCYFVVKYAFDDGEDLPTGPGLRVLVDRLKKYSPGNTLIVDEYIKPPKHIVITYVVFCQCTKQDFELPIQRPNVRAIRCELENFHM